MQNVTVLRDIPGKLHTFTRWRNGFSQRLNSLDGESVLDPLASIIQAPWCGATGCLAGVKGKALSAVPGSG